MKLFWWFVIAWGLETVGLLVVGGGRRLDLFSLFLLWVGQTVVWWGMFFLLRFVLGKEGSPREGWIVEWDRLLSYERHQVREARHEFLALREELDTWQEVLAGLPFPVMVTDKQGRLLFTNRAFSEHCEARVFCWEIPSYPIIQAMEDLFRRGGGSSDPLPLKNRFYALHVSLVGGRRFVVMLFDRTDEVEREQREKDFIAYAAHELKTPLTALQGYLELLEPSLGEGQKSLYGVIWQHVIRLGNLVHDLLSLNRFESGPLEYERFDLVDLVRRLELLFRPRFEARSISLTVEVPERPVVMEADPLALEEVIVNLIENALRYTDSGGVVVRVSSDEQYVTLVCEDTGIGISARDMAHIFDRFYVVDKARSRKTGGTGLGLSLVKGIVQRHRGTIVVESEVGRGSRFVVTLPLVQSETPL